jgi:O-antigen ligase/tetratricopeptide (TPR) repeat protein
MRESPPGLLPPRQLALALALAYFVLIGGTNVGTYVVPFAAVNAVIATVLVAAWMIELPRRNDLTDRALILALLAFLLACVTSAFPRMSFEAATSVTGWAAAFGIARGALISGRAERAMVTVLAVCGLVLTAGFLATWIPQWISWWRATGTVPPLDLPLRPGPYRHYHIAAMLLALSIPAFFQFRQRRGVRLAAWIGALAALTGVYMSGSRTVWVALILVGAAVVVPKLRWRPTVIASGVALTGAIGLLAIAGALGSTTSRLLTTLTISVRGDTWLGALAGWLERPLTGWGPGSFAAVFSFGGAMPVYPDPGGHAHNVIVQVLLEAGILGLAALLLAVGALVLGIRRNPHPSPYAISGLAVFILMSLTDLPSNFPMVLVIGTCWAALAAPRRSEVPETSSRRLKWPRALSTVLGLVVLVAVASTLIGWAAFDEARADLQRGDLSAARRALDRSVAFDPSMALYRREHGIRAAEAGDLRLALSDLQEALRLNAADTTTLRALAILMLDDQQPDHAIGLARRAVSLWGSRAENQLLLAWIATRTGEAKLATEALAGTLTWYPWTAAAPTWVAMFGPNLDAPLQQATAKWQAYGRQESWEATWLRAMVGKDPVQGLPASFGAMGAIIRCDLPLAAEYLAETGTAAQAPASLSPRLILARLMHDESAYRRALGVAEMRGSQLALLSYHDPGPASPFSDPEQDVGLYKRIPLGAAHIEPLLPTPGEGLAAWLQDPLSAAHRGAPSSGLARCAS